MDGAVRRRGWIVKVLATPLGLLLSAGVVWQSSHSAFTATTANGTNTFAAGSVALADDDSTSAMFTVTGLKPGSTGSRCIAVTYNGSLAAAVKLYVKSGDLTDNGLAAYLNLTVEEGSSATFAGGCGSFTGGSTAYTGTLAGLAGSHTAFGSGVGAWTPTGAGQVKAYRITYTLADNNAAQNGTSTVNLTWEAQNT